MGKTFEPKAFSFQCMTELTTNKTKKKLKKIIIISFSNHLLNPSKVLRALIFSLTQPHTL